MSLSGKQLFILALVCLLVVAFFAYLDRTYVPVVFSLVFTILGVALHINGVNTGVPLAPAPVAKPPAVEVQS